MHTIRRIAGSLLLLSLALVLTSCITINPSAMAHLRVTPSVPSAAPAGDPAVFTANLIAALVSRNDAALQAAMGSPFIWADWQGSGQMLAPVDAAARVQGELIQDAMALTFVAPPVIDEWMRGTDPLTIWPPDVLPAAVVGVSGLGAAGQDQAILIIAQAPDGGFYWYGLLLAPGGFANQPGNPPAAIVLASVQPPLAMLPTDVRQVLTLGVVGIFTGPGAQYEQLGATVRGQTFNVQGVSADGQWWAITCQNAGGICWISANPTFVRPLIVSNPVATATATAVPPTPWPTPWPTVRPTLPPPPSPTPAPSQPERIQFAPGQERAVRSGPLWTNTVKQFVFFAAAGQTPTLRFNSPSPAASMGIIGLADGVVYKPQSSTGRDFTFRAARSQDYLISLLAPVNTSYTLELLIPRSGPTPQPTAQPSPERISFAPGQVTAVRTGLLVNGAARQYIFRALARQSTTVLLTGLLGSDVNFSLRGASDGVLYKSLSDPAREWSLQLPRTQDYLITVAASGETSYSLELTILPLGPTPTVVPPTQEPAERIQFAPGQDSANRSGPLVANQYRRYLFGGMQGQTATISLRSPSPSAYFTVVGMTDGIPYKSQGSSALDFTFTLPLSQDYLISIAASVNTSYSLRLSIPPLSGPTPLPPTPTMEPTLVPTLEPTLMPTLMPTPTAEPTLAPTLEPTLMPTLEPTLVPTLEPTLVPTVEPPTVEPPTVEPPTVEPPTVEPPTVEPTVEGS